MKKLLPILFLFIFKTSTAQVVTIPDANFLAKLLSASTTNTVALNNLGNSITIDSNSNGTIEASEAQLVVSLNIDNASITDLTGIQSFSNLNLLNCQQNQIASLNLSGLTALQNLNCQNNAISNLDLTGLNSLQSLNCDSNQLTVLNVNGLTNLVVVSCVNNFLNTFNATGLTSIQNLYCYNNQLQNLLISGLPNLQYLECQNNQINALNTSGLANLQNLNCFNNQIGTLDLSASTNLHFVNCASNQLTNLTLTGLANLQYLDCTINLLNNLNTSGLSALQTLRCANNLLTTLDVSLLTNLSLLNCSSNQLTSLFIKNGQNETLTFSANNNLSFICADDGQLSNVQSLITSYGMTNCATNSYCTFVPGGNYNTINGTVLFDSNNNGCDTNDIAQPFIKMNISSGTTNGATVTNSSGNYTFYTQSGNFTIAPNFENTAWFTTSPTSATVTMANNNFNTATQNFCITANGNHKDLEVVIAPIFPAIPGHDAIYKIAYKNKGNQTLSGEVSFQYNDSVLDFVTATVSPTLNTFGSLSWDYANLLPFENRSFYVTLNVNTPTETPPVNLNDVLTFSANITPQIADEFQSDNQFSYNQTVVNSFDPNDITCMEGTLLPPSEIGNYLHYVINFENIGNSDAENVVIEDSIDPTQFDINSLQVLNSSDEVMVNLTGNVAKFIFKNIRIHHGGHGNILLKIRSKSNLHTGDHVTKDADIFFDYNQPISTNIANTIYQSLNTAQRNIDNSITIFPNPSADTIAIKAKSTINSIAIFDAQGRLLRTKLADSNSVSIDLSEYSKGIYLIKVTATEGTKVEKLIKE